MIQKDLNLFTVYKKSSSGSSGKGYKGIIVMSVLFILVVGFTYGGLWFAKLSMQNKTSSIRNELASPDVVEVQQKLQAEVQKNELMNQYISAAKSAKQSFEKSRVIDWDVFKKILTSMPSDVTISNYAITSTSISLSCKSVSFPSSATFSQSLGAKDLFSLVTYDAVNREPDGKYVFTLIFSFDGEDVE